MSRWTGLVIVALAAGMLSCTPTDPSGKVDGSDEGPDSTNSRPRVGKPAPDFQGDFAVNGKPIRISELKGKVVLIDFWAVWCQPCVAALPHLVKWNSKYKSSGLEIVGVVVSNPETDNRLGFDRNKGKLIPVEDPTGQTNRAMLRDFAEYHKMEYLVMTLATEQGGLVYKNYGVYGIPRAVLIDRNGIVRDAFSGGGEDTARQIEMAIKKLLDQN